jgi:RNA polymerase primary sigma factor
MDKKYIDESIQALIDSIDTGKHSKRNAKIVAQYFGFDGNGGASMQQVGDEFQLSRERVRRVLDDYKKEIPKLFNSEDLREVSKFIAGKAPISKSRLDAELLRAGYVKAPCQIEGIVNLLELVFPKYKESKKAVYKIQHMGSHYLINHKNEAAAQNVESTALRRISHNGAAHTAKLEKFVDSSDKETRKNFVRDVLSARSDFIWLDENKSWGYLGEHGKNRLTHRLKAIFSLIKSAPIAAVENGILRSWNKAKTEETELPPTHIILALLRDTGNFRIDTDNNIHVKKPYEAVENVAPGDIAVFNVIKTSHPQTKKESEIKKALFKEPADIQYSYSMALNYSPLFKKIDRGQYGLVGTPID